MKWKKIPVAKMQSVTSGFDSIFFLFNYLYILLFWLRVLSEAGVCG